MVRFWFKIFFRNSQKNWLNVMVNISGLALGLMGLIIVLLNITDEWSHNAWNPNKNEVYQVIHHMPEGDIWSTSTTIEGVKYQADIPEIEEYYLSNSWYESGLVTIHGKSYYTEDILIGTDNFFSFFPFPVLAGNTADLKKSKFNIAISQSQATLLFNDQSAIGKTVSYDGKDFMIVAVYELNQKSFYAPHIVMVDSQEHKEQWGSYYSNLLVKLTKGASKQVVIDKMNDVVERYSAIPSAKEEGLSLEAYNQKYGSITDLDVLSKIRLEGRGDDSPEGSGDLRMLLVMLSLSFLLILISAVNFINLTIASAFQRAKEIGVKKTLGLNKSQIAFSFLLEVMLEALIALVLALIGVELILPYFNQFMGVDLVFSSWIFLFQIIGLTLFIAAITGLIPALYVANYKAVDVLKGNFSRSKKGQFVRQLMLGFQFVISGFFLIGAMIMYTQVTFMVNQELGFSGEQVVIIYLNDRTDAFSKYELAKKELIKHPNIRNISSNTYVPGGFSQSSTNADYKDAHINALSNAIDYNYLDMMGIEMVKGRGLSSNFASDTLDNILINETMAKNLGISENPIGIQINLGYRENVTIVGVVKDYFIDGLDSEIGPMFLFHWKTFPWMSQNFSNMQFKLSGENTPETMAEIAQFWKQNIEQGYPFEYRFLDKQFARTYQRFENQQALFTVLTLIVIWVSLLGLFALATLSIQQRLKEVAIRKTLGASEYEIVSQLVKSFIKVVLLSSVFLIPLAFYVMQDWLDNFVYRVEMPWWPYFLTPVVLIVLVLLVVGLKAFNATKVDLIKYLKFE
tara:strand:+ start:9968 stop:12361 length:2394 start_codon:yes stop_codon:yes gene_type:complete